MSVQILSALPSFKQLSKSLCDDWVDRLNHVYTVYLLVLFAVLVSSMQYVGAPIYCWVPAELHLSFYKNYIHNYCWVKNTYYIPFFEALPRNVNEREEEEITYYQWVPIILLTQALMFKLPNVFWKMLHGTSGVNIDKLCKNAGITQCLTPKDRQNAFLGVLFTYEKWINKMHKHRLYTEHKAENRGRFMRFFCYFIKQEDAVFMTVLYLTIKILFLANALGQIFLLNDFIASSSENMYGVEWLHSFQSESPPELDKGYRFPRVTMCDVLIRQMSNVNRYTIQCVLPINLFNEKIFIILWFWIGIVAVLSLYNTIKWLILLVFRSNNYQFVKKYLKIAGTALSEADKQVCKDFADKYLRSDGCFVARMIAMNSNDMMVMEMLTTLFVRYRDNKLKNQPRENHTDTIHNRTGT